MASRRMADAKRIDGPIRILPEDILIEIFLCCTPIMNHHDINWSTDGDTFDSLSPLDHPWNISHVSHLWREIALSLPRLWSVVYLDFTRYTHFSTQQCSFVGSLFFERSANSDLCVNVASREIDISDHPLIPLLKETTTRWRTLNSHMSSPSLQSSLFHVLQIPSICRLTVTFQTEFRGSWFLATVLAHPHFDRISSLRITCCMTELRSRSFDYNISAKTLLNFLKYMPGVEVFRLKDRCVTSEFLDSLVITEKRAVVLPSLIILDLHECDFANHDEALNMILHIVESRSLVNISYSLSSATN